MADLAALLLLVAGGWWDGALRRAGATRPQALAAGALLLITAGINVGLGGPVPLRVNVGGALPAAAMLAVASALPTGGGRLAAGSCAAACLLYGLSAWSGPLAAVGLPLAAGAAAVLVAGGGPLSLLAAAAAPALADVVRWIVAAADGLPGTIWIGGGPSFLTLVLGVTVAALALGFGARGKHVSR